MYLRLVGHLLRSIIRRHGMMTLFMRIMMENNFEWHSSMIAAQTMATVVDCLDDMGGPLCPLVYPGVQAPSFTSVVEGFIEANGTLICHPSPISINPSSRF